MPIWNDFTANTSTGDYLHEDVSRLKQEGNRRAVDAAKKSVQDMTEFIFRVFPQFEICTSGTNEIPRYIQREGDLIRKQPRDGTMTRPPTREEWADRVRQKIKDIQHENRREIKDGFFRLTRNGVHVGAIYHQDTNILREFRGVTHLSTLITYAIDVGRNDNDAWMLLSAELVAYALKNPTVFLEGDPRSFQISEIRLPNMYDGSTEHMMKAAIDYLDANGVDYTTWPNTPRQDAAGIVKLKKMKLRSSR